MKIGFDAKRIFHNRSGLGNYSRDIVRMLIEYFPQHQYWLYNPKKKKIPFSLSANSREELPTGFFSKKLSSLWRRKWITGQLKKDGIDLYHGLSNELPAGIASSGIASVVTMHDLIFYRYPEWYKAADRIIHQKKARQATREATHIIAISEQTKKDLIHYLHIPEQKISVIYQGCHTAFKQSYTPADLQSVKEKFNLPHSYVLSVGTIEIRKNLLTTLKSLLLHDLPLVVVGKQTDYYNTALEFISEKNLQHRVHFLQNVSMPELAMIYQQAFVLCYPSIYEGFGIPIIEALFSRTPVITNREGCFAEAGGPASFYVDVFNEKMIADAIHQLKDKNVYEQTIVKGIEYVQQFNDEVIATQMMALYNKVLDKKQ